VATKTIDPFEPIASTKSVARGEVEPDLRHVQDFLCRFGYLPADADFEASRLDDPTAEALTKYQRCFGLAETGEFDDDTRVQMTTHRCGLPDLAAGVAFTARCSWANPNLTYAFESGTNDTPGEAEFNAVRRAFATWAEASPLTFTEVTQAQSPDIAVDWRPATDPDHSMVGGVLAHADFPPGCGVVTNTLPKPVHFDDSEHQWADGAQVSAFDIETVALHEIGHIIGLQHSDAGGSVMFPTVSANHTLRDLTDDDLAGLAELYPPNTLEAGTYTIRQESSGRFLDAHTSSNDFSIVTRTRQDNDTQRWILQPVGAVFTIRQKQTGRFLDAHESGSNDFSAVTRTAQDNDSQRWVVLPDPARPGVATVQQLLNGRFLDAHTSSDDFSAVTRTRQGNDTQRWILAQEEPDTYTIQQEHNRRFLDAHTSGNDFSAVTRTRQSNDTQRWILGLVGMVCTIQQKVNGRFVDAHESSANDFSAVTRGPQYNDSQRWVLVPAGDGSFTVQQLLKGRYLDAHENSANDFSAVTRTRQGNDTQRWVFERP
jgi:hypothetical protein